MLLQRLNYQCVTKALFHNYLITGKSNNFVITIDSKHLRIDEKKLLSDLRDYQNKAMTAKTRIVNPAVIAGSHSYCLTNGSCFSKYLEYK